MFRSSGIPQNIKYNNKEAGKTPELSVIVPTYNESKNIDNLVTRAFAALKKHEVNAELIVVDDNSPDGTAKVAEKMSNSYPVRTYIRTKREGPGPAILDGIRLANAQIACVMDGD
ncbi:MAG: glycosyltransferase [Candidatus Margulisiibacteriota bacterium]